MILLPEAMLVVVVAEVLVTVVELFAGIVVAADVLVKSVVDKMGVVAAGVVVVV